MRGRLIDNFEYREIPTAGHCAQHAKQRAAESQEDDLGLGWQQGIALLEQWPATKLKVATEG